jgi:hypothetical protein
MTSDGIRSDDWDKIHACALDVVNASSANDAEAGAHAAPFVILDELETKYGRRPSLLATRADFVESSQERARLFEEAYQEAQRISDLQNMEAIAHSLTEFYVEEMRGPEMGGIWLAQWREHVGPESNESQQGELSRLGQLLLDTRNE